MQIQHTHNKKFFSSRYGRLVLFMERPDRTKQKKYREPQLMARKWFPDVSTAKLAKDTWDARDGL